MKLLFTIILSLLSLQSYAQLCKINMHIPEGVIIERECINNQNKEELPQNKDIKFPTKEEVMAQKIAFFTKELSLTPEEATEFWPIYNQEWDKMLDAHMKTGNTLRKLNKALNNTPTPTEQEINYLMNEYFNACKVEVEIQQEMFKKLSSVVPIHKAAKTFSLEEKFRVLLIKSLRGNK